MQKIILADSQELTRKGLESVIADIFVDCPIDIVANEQELLGALANADSFIVIFDPACLDIDLLMPAELDRLHFLHPNTHWIALANDFDEAVIHHLSDRTYVSMMLKDCNIDEFKTSFRYAMQQKRFLCHQVTNRLLNVVMQPEKGETLSQIELDVLRLIAMGKTVKDIAAIRKSSTHTIVSHKKNIFRKIGVNSVHDATRFALKNGIIDIEYYI